MAKKKEITIKEEAYMVKWVDVYFNTNFNGRITSKFLKPHLSLESCEVDAARMLGKDRVKELIAIKQEHNRMKSEITFDFIVKELKSIIYDVNEEEIERDDTGRITSKPDRRSKIEAIKTLAKIAGLDNHEKKVDITTNGENINKIIWVEEKTYPNKLND